MICLSRPYPFKFFKGCLPKILLGLLLNTLSYMFLRTVMANEEICQLSKNTFPWFFPTFCQVLISLWFSMNFTSIAFSKKLFSGVTSFCRDGWTLHWLWTCAYPPLCWASGIVFFHTYWLWFFLYHNADKSLIFYDQQIWQYKNQTKI